MGVYGKGFRFPLSFQLYNFYFILCVECLPECMPMPGVCGD